MHMTTNKVDMKKLLCANTLVSFIHNWLRTGFLVTLSSLSQSHTAPHQTQTGRGHYGYLQCNVLVPLESTMWNCQVIWTAVSLRAYSPLAPNQENRARPPDTTAMPSNTRYHRSSESSVCFEWLYKCIIHAHMHHKHCCYGTVTMCARCQGCGQKLWHTDTAEGAAALRVWWHCGQDAVGGPCGGEKTRLITQHWHLQLFN